jgi:hypothetical protein
VACSLITLVLFLLAARVIQAVRDTMGITHVPDVIGGLSVPA